MGRKKKKTVEKEADDGIQHIMWMNRIFADDLYEDPEGEAVEDNYSEVMNGFVAWAAGSHGEGMKDLLEPSPSKDYEVQIQGDIGDNTFKKFAMVRSFLRFKSSQDECEEHFCNAEQLVEWVATNDSKHRLQGGDLKEFKLIIPHITANAEEIGITFVEGQPLEESIIDNATEATPDTNAEEVLEAALEKQEQIAKEIEEKAEEEQVEPEPEPSVEEEKEIETEDEAEEEHVHGPNCNHSHEEPEGHLESVRADLPHLIPQEEDPRDSDPEWGLNGDPLPVVRGSEGLVSWSALATVVEKQEGIEDLFKKNPDFDKMFASAIEEMHKDGVMQNGRCLIDAILVVLDIDPRMAHRIVAIYEQVQN